MEQIPYDLLVDLAEGRVSNADAAAIRARIALDPPSQQELARLEALVALMRSDDSVDAPDHVINRAIRLLRRPAAERPPSLLRRMVATLMSDSWQASMATGLRALTTWPRALLLSAGDRELDLQIAPHGERWQLRGQVLGAEEAGEVALGEGEGQVIVSLNELGEFTLPPVATGRYTLVVTQGGLEIVVPDLELGPSPKRS
jgi:anti-sigma factor RsiW